MPPRSLRRGDRQPMPGAVRKGCPRPKALRFASPFGGASPFGDGSYSGNILQGGVPLQPQDYLLDGITPLSRCIVITGAATVALDATTGAAVWMAHNMVLIGASASLSAATNCKGLLGFVNGLVALRGGAHLHMDKLGKAGNFGNLSPDMLLPTTLAQLIATHRLKAYVIHGNGAPGGAAVPANNGNVSGNAGSSAGSMQTGGGGTGLAATYVPYVIGRGGKGGPCSGGAGSGGSLNGGSTDDAGDFGGPGSSGSGSGNDLGGGGAGDPPGAATATAVAGEGRGGGLLGIFARRVDVDSGCCTSADGANGGVWAGQGYGVPGGSAGGGIIIIATMPGGYSNRGTVRAAGGVAVAANATIEIYGGPGGAGSVNIFEFAS